MTVEELFQKLSYGELSNLAVAVDATGTLKKDQQNRVIHFANEALTRLHTRFSLMERSQVVSTSPTQEVVVPLVNDSDPQNPVQDVVQVLSILTAWGEPVAFTTNVDSTQIAVYGDEVHIPKTTQVYELQINLQIRHPKLNPIVDPASATTGLAQEIVLIPELEEALTAYIAAKMYGNMNSADAVSTAAGHRNRYEQVCAEALASGVLPAEMRPLNKFEARGFV